ncbi:GAF and ANTAR domain-containing protein [Rhodococcus sp. T2V]|uniref:GAF and ANTAR domain-containing protein n=1 Tax=Rhodococcus sp. T2V TaxID=3034164 RepID=UPI0023E2F2FD|nr:GAF and ANTAR domain-containing protein [Rhodococcus sp. T2V]MDF3313189.1 GAF and ANTAR domain-containing protein [Rhodococcus sp. T2V]
MNDFDHAGLGAMMAEVARSWTAPTDLDSTLHAITQAAVELIPGAGSADILTISGRHKFRSLAPTCALPADLDAVQARHGQGPCVEAALDGEVVRSDDLENETRWPEFTREAVDSGVRSVVSFRLYTRTHVVGALNVLAMTAHAFDDESVAIGEVLAAHAAIAIITDRREVQLRSAVVSRDLIGQAKGMLMERFDIGADQAFTMLTKLSQQSNIPLAKVAEKVVDLGPDRRH